MKDIIFSHSNKTLFVKISQFVYGTYIAYTQYRYFDLVNIMLKYENMRSCDRKLKLCEDI